MIVRRSIAGARREDGPRTGSRTRFTLAFGVIVAIKLIALALAIVYFAPALFGFLGAK